MKLDRFVATNLLLSLLLPASAFAEGPRWTEQEFQEIVTRLKQNPDSHARLITRCIEDGQSELKQDGRLGDELESLNSIGAEEVVQEACRRLVKGMTAGKVTYEMYRDWSVEDGKTVALPDWR
ncbi:hypothetical protein [Shinella sp.]|uniref:hypothetical protein n=1 Tax=Shinella sp. TaxID=1870904 RepID=UPI0040368E1F